MNKKAIYGIIAIAIIAVAAFAIYNFSLPTPPAELTKISYLLGWKHTLENYAGFYVAMYKGYYADVGIELEMVEGFGTMASAQVLGSGQTDFAELSGQALIVSVSQGINLMAISQGYQINPTAFFTLDPNIKTMKDFEGKTIGVSPSASTYVAYIEACANAGVDRSKVEEISTDYAQWVTLASGKIDVTAGTYIENMVPLADMGYPNGTKSWYIRAVDYGVKDYGSGTIGVRADWLEDPVNYDLTKRFIQATQKGFEYAFTHIGEALDVFMHYNPDRDRDYEYSLASVAIEQCQNVSSVWEHGYGWMQQSVWEETEAALYAANFTSTRVDVKEGSCWTNEFLNLK